MKANFFITLFFLFSLTIETASATEEKSAVLNLELFDNKIPVSQEEINQWINKDPYLNYSDNYQSEIEDVNFCPFSSPIICEMLDTQKKKYSVKKFEDETYSREAIKSFLNTLSEKYNQAPTNATFGIKDDKVSNFSLSKNGYAINEDKSLETIISFLNKEESNSNSIQLSYNIIEPDIKYNDAEKLGIKEIIGEGKSNFSGSTTTRIFNIQVALKKFDGLIIKPGEEFSFVKNLGEVDGEHGYKQELVIKQGSTELEFGGGVCQVSTTAFRAAINSGLEITARRNHAYPVHYYDPQGMDAAVYVPSPDLKFINNTPGYILIQTEIDVAAKELVFKFYGTNDGRKVEVDGPHVLEKNSDGSMKTVFYQKVTDADGKIIIDEDFKSSYKSPNDYPRESEQKITSKPDNWSNKQWDQYKKDNGL